MTEQEINNAIEEILNDIQLRKELGVDRKQAYKYRKVLSVGAKLELLWRAGKLKFT